MKRISLFVLCFIFWLFLVWRLDWQNLLVGMIVAVFVSLLFGNLEKEKERIRPFGFLVFFAKLLWLWIKASVIEMYLVILPQEINVEDFRIKVSVSSEKSKAFLIMALNLSPNITVVDVQGDEIIINSHGRQEEKVKKDAEKIEALVEKIFIC